MSKISRKHSGFDLSESERQKLEALAKHYGMTMSETIRLLINEEFERINHEAKENNR